MTAQAWKDNMCIEDLLVAAIYAMTDCEKGRVLAGSVEGPGGESGPLRVHFPAQNSANVLQVGSQGLNPQIPAAAQGCPCIAYLCPANPLEVKPMVYYAFGMPCLCVCWRQSSVAAG